MVIGELIEQLKALRAEHGDLECFVDHHTLEKEPVAYADKVQTLTVVYAPLGSRTVLVIGNY